jgi:hypothetical protein
MLHVLLTEAQCRDVQNRQTTNLHSTASMSRRWLLACIGLLGWPTEVEAHTVFVHGEACRQVCRLQGLSQVV